MSQGHTYLMRVYWILVWCVMLLPSAIRSQALPDLMGDPNNPALKNPSFEDVPRPSNPPKGWIDCGFPSESAPDVQPSGAWEVWRPAIHGYTYLGMVARDNDTWESVSQRLDHPLMADRCYSFSIYLCTSSEYWSAVTPDSLKGLDVDLNNLPKKNFNQPIKLRIWGGSGYCDKKELLTESATISNTSWKKYTFRLEPKREVTHVILEAFYKTPTLFPYNGNLLLDHASAFTMIACNDDEELVIPPTVQIMQPIEKVDVRFHRVKVNALVRNIKSKSQIDFYVNTAKIEVFDFDPSNGSFSTTTSLKEGKNTIRIIANNSEGTASDETQVYIIEKNTQAQTEAEKPPPPTSVKASTPRKDYKILKDLNKSVAAGEIFKVDRLYFLADSSNIHDAASFEVLDELYQFLSEHPGIKIEVGGHTSGGSGSKPIDSKYSVELSKARAKTVAYYLVSKGIGAGRIKYKGYGSRKPLASNSTAEGRKQNQRVEIKILST